MITYPIAKINLGLNVVERRADGYHNLQTVFYPVPIKDTLEVWSQETGGRSQESEGRRQEAGVRRQETGVECDLQVTGIEVLGDVQQNLVVRAYKLLKEDFPTLPCVTATLHKGIPTQAGMGGGSSDCAYMIRLLNDMFGLGLTDDEMIAYAARLGADCAFFIKSTPCYAEGIGERLEPIALDLKGWHIGVVRPDIPVPTKEAFSRIRPHYPAVNCRQAVMQPVETWRDVLVNDFEESVFALHPEIGEVKERLYKMGATYAAMSGSGSALFGLFRERPDALGREFPDMFTFSSLF